MTKTKIYQLETETWRREGTLGENIKAMTEFLPKIKDMGYNAVRVSAIHPSTEHDYEANFGRFDVMDYRAVSAIFGTMRDFVSFIDAAHEQDLKVLIDLTLDHTSKHHHWVKKCPKYYYRDIEFDTYLAWFPNGPDGEINHALVREFQAIVDFWIEKGVDGFYLNKPQNINRTSCIDMYGIDSEDPELLHMTADVINAIFENRKVYLLMECDDKTGNTAVYYAHSTPVHAIVDTALRENIKDGYDKFVTEFKKAHERLGRDLVLSTQGVPMAALPSSDESKKIATELAFGRFNGEQYADPDTIIIVQGQELGLGSPEMAAKFYLGQSNESDSFVLHQDIGAWQCACSCS